MLHTLCLINPLITIGMLMCSKSMGFTGLVLWGLTELHNSFSEKSGLIKDLQSSLAESAALETSISMTTPPIPFHAPFCWMRIERVQRASEHSMGTKAGPRPPFKVSNCTLAHWSIRSQYSAFSDITDNCYKQLAYWLRANLLVKNTEMMKSGISVANR